MQGVDLQGGSRGGGKLLAAFVSGQRVFAFALFVMDVALQRGYLGGIGAVTQLFALLQGFVVVALGGKHESQLPAGALRQ